MAYIDGFVVPVPSGRKEAYREMAATKGRELGSIQLNRIKL